MNFVDCRHVVNKQEGNGGPFVRKNAVSRDPPREYCEDMRIWTFNFSGTGLISTEQQVKYDGPKLPKEKLCTTNLTYRDVRSR